VDFTLATLVLAAFTTNYFIGSAASPLVSFYDESGPVFVVAAATT